MKRLWRRLLPQVPGGRVPQYIAPRPQPRPSLLSTQDTQKQPTKREGACCVCRGKGICTAALCVSMGERRCALPHTFATACAVCAKSERNMPQVTHRRPDPDWLGLAAQQGQGACQAAAVRCCGTAASRHLNLGFRPAAISRMRAPQQLVGPT